MLPFFMHFYPGMSPSDFYSLTVREFNALSEFIESSQKEMNRA